MKQWMTDVMTIDKQMVRLGNVLSKPIGAHYRAIGRPGLTDPEYAELRRMSDESVALVKYLIQHLESRHAAVVLSKSAGMPGYINLR